MKGFRLILLSASVVIGAAILSRVEGAAPDTTLPGPFGPPSWDTLYPSKQRFLVLTQFASEAVLDRETGLVWMLTVPTGTWPWDGALASCRQQLVGNRRGWRLPSYEEMTTLLDPAYSNPALPHGNPFKNFQPTDIFWTATTEEPIPNDAYVVAIATATTYAIAPKTSSFRFWCVRGGQSTTNPF